METPAASLTSEHPHRDRLARSLQHIVDEAEQMLKSAQRSGNEQFNAARDKFEVQLRHAKAELKDLQEGAVHNAKRAARVTDEAVHQHPYASMGIAVGVGLLIGMLISRR